MGLLNSVGIGIGAAANAAQPYILNMQQAEIQKLRDDRMAEIAKGTAKYAADLEIENIPRKQAAELPGLKAKQALEYSEEAIAGEAALAKAKRDPLDAEVKRAALKESKEGKVTFQSLGDGRIAKVDKSGNITGFMTNPETGKPIIGKTDLSDQQKAIVNGYLTLAGKTDDPDQAKKYADLAIEAAAGGKSTSVMDKLKGVDPENGKPGAASTATQPPAARAAVSTQKTPTLPANPTQADIQKFDNYFGYGKAKELLNARGNK